MTANEQKELGELTAEIRGLRRDFESVTSTLTSHDKRIDSLEGTRDEGKGGARLIQVGKGIVAFVFALAAAIGLTKGPL